MREECQSVIKNAPVVWGTIVPHSTMANIEEVTNAINTSQDHLHEAWFQSDRWGSRGPRGEKCTHKVAQVASDDEGSPPSEPWGLSDLEEYEDQEREVLFNSQNKTSLSNP